MPVLEGENPSPKEGVKVVGCDERATKSDPTTDISQQLENLKVEDASSGSTGCREFSSDTEIGANEKTASTNEGSCNKLPARSQLYEICVGKKWKLPLYECCKEEGPPHMRKFTYKVIVEIEETEKTVLECFGAPHSKKKSAAEHAAEAALWYLKNIGYDSKDR
ncbi:hypothetical protein PRUPE_3G095800 [Prunus persica]|uniref:DRBM domain-containing protein n=1 Tax=Prunus persica TaxID=3760 RepID=A0A251PXW3_PRUPE|nr:ribonuclease 3-like protein 1 isoform X2 [Prunus persica]ONI16391.1 hypothetical protein PRUPE_3G095800 [Prunus persica]ONI16392.1 hypothetical protein PRUPE_3G095800 [Prunus persica]